MFRRKGHNKFNAIRSSGFGSKLEAAVHQILLLREKMGEISDIRCQQTVRLTEAKITYRVDFSFLTKEGEKVWCEAKGYRCDVWVLKKKLWKFYGPGKLEIWSGNYTRPVLEEVIIP